MYRRIYSRNSDIAVHDGLIAYWPLSSETIDFNDAATGVRDLSINEYHGRPINISESRIVTSPTGEGLSLGGHSVVALDDFSYAGLNNFSTSFWMNITGSWVNMVIGNYKSWDFGGYTVVEYRNRIYCFINREGYGTWSSIYTGISLHNRWIHVVLTYSSNYLNSYASFDGIKRRFYSYGNPIIDSGVNQIYLGGSNTTSRHYNYGYPFYGKLSDVRIYDKILSEEEVRELYELGITGE